MDNSIKIRKKTAADRPIFHQPTLEPQHETQNRKMKIHKTILVAAGLAALNWSTTLEAEISFVGNDWDTNAKWRDPSVSKVNDTDQDHIYGSAGYYLAAGLREGYKGTFLGDHVIAGESNTDDINTLPDYITSLEFADTAERGRSWGGQGANFGRLDVVSGSTGLTGAPILKTGEFTDPMVLILKRTDSPAFRLTLILGNNPNEAGFDDPEGQLITIDDGSGSVSELTGDLDLDRTEGYTTYQTWDISAGSSDIEIELIGMPEGTGVARLTGFAIDVAGVNPPEILGQPVGGLFLAGTQIELSVSAGGSNPKFQWHKDGQVIAGATNSILSLNNLNSTDAGAYHVVVSNSAGSATSEVAEISLAENLSAQIANYQAKVAAVPSLISNYTFDGLNLDDRAGPNNGTAAGTVSFGEGLGGGAAKALLLSGFGHVNLEAPESFDFFDLSGTIQLWLRADWTTSPGYNPCIFADRDGAQVNYSLHLTANKNQIVFWNGTAAAVANIPAAGLDWHLLSAVFENGNYSLYWDGEEILTTELDLGPAPEAPTQLGSSSPGGAESWVGALDEVAFFEDPLSADTIESHYLAFLAGEPPSIRTEPVGGVYLVGKPLELTVDAVGTALSYQWFKNDTAIEGSTADSLSVPSVTLADQGSYHVIVSNPAGSSLSNSVEITIAEALAPNLIEFQTAVKNQEGLLSYYTFDDANAEDSQGSNDGTLAGAVTFGEGIGGGAAKGLNMDGEGHLTFGPVDAFDFFDGIGTVQLWLRADWTSGPGFNPCIFSDREGGPVNYSIHLNQEKNLIMYWNGSGVSSMGIPNAGQDWHLLTVVFDIDTWAVYWDGQFVEELEHAMGPSSEVATHIGSSSTAGGEVWPGAMDEVAFFNEALSASDVEAMFNAFAAGEPPEILADPEGGRFFAGADAELAVQARGANIEFQWTKDGELIAGVTSETLILSSLSSDDQGSYQVTVSNGSGEVTSAAALVVVVTPDLEAYQVAVRNEDSLISYYTFDDETAADSVAGNDGLLEGAVDFQTGLGGTADRALILDGQSHVALTEVEDFDFTDGTGTVEAWIRADWDGSPGYNPCIIANRDGGPVRWSMHMSLNKAATGVWNGASYAPQPISGADGTWRHLVVVYTETGIEVYWDGELAGTSSQTLTGPIGPTQFGSSSNFDTTEGWIGALDEIAFYSEPLTPSVIQAHYEALVGPLQQADPILSYQLTGAELTISWPGELTGFMLESTSDLLTPTWEEVDGVNNNSVTVDSSQGTRFFRLRTP